MLHCCVLTLLLLTVSGGMAALFYVLCVVSCFNSGLQLLCFRQGSQASWASCGLVSPEGVWCIWLSYSGGLSCGCSVFGFLLGAQISSYLHRAPAFPVNWLIHGVFAYISTWTGTLLHIIDSLCYEWFSSLPAAISFFSKSPGLIYSATTYTCIRSLLT